MNWSKVYIVIIFQLHIAYILGHGMLIEPVNRGSAWRKGFNNSQNNDDNGNNCGGYKVIYLVHTN